MNILFTICGRGGSKGLKNKNLKKMNGVPLVYYTLAVIRLYQEAHPWNAVKVAVNTDSQELFETIRSQKAVFDIQEVERKGALAGDRAAKVDVIKDTYLRCRNQGAFDVVVDLDITSPMRRLKDVEEAVRALKEDAGCDLVFSVVPARRSPYFNMVEKRQAYYRKICPSRYTARQQAPKAYELNASIYAYNPEFLEREIEKTILDYNCGIVEMPDYLVLDIDSEEDFRRMSMLMEYFGREDRELARVMELAGNL